MYYVNVNRATDSRLGTRDSEADYSRALALIDSEANAHQVGFTSRRPLGVPVEHPRERNGLVSCLVDIGDPEECKLHRRNRASSRSRNWECICEKEVCGSENRRRREDHQTGRLGKGGSVAYWPSDDIKEAFGSSLRVRVPPSPTFISGAIATCSITYESSLVESQLVSVVFLLFSVFDSCFLVLQLFRIVVAFSACDVCGLRFVDLFVLR
ncbi:hypothetical protein BHE74_00001744 [Ensete ventricosum]|uniref:Uncharacterized protein n=1 Tax=Ensete ventricosum TaxID=4639 RepID=A0A444G6S2_ENSVE|nr:hypothetical protein GW17_00004843 [Ensete ventricosum]RWW89320.1 hypothetical protein BHE74_00001744 [Ensete ventricosum]RZR70449.1 hypothetical protein BHM03_00000055 [Ensete ventricosum]